MEEPLSDYDLRVKQFMEDSAQDFADSAGSYAEQRVALGWFVRWCAEEDFSETELRNLLGVASPCVLSLAGYSEAAARQVMDMLGDIRKDEIPSSYDLRLKEFMVDSARDFAESAGSYAEQRMALCWFLRRGAEEDFSETELKELLGVSSPCVLSLAGYSEAATRQVMEMLGDITKDEIDTARS